MVQINRQVWMEKTCPDHGRCSVLLASDVAHYYQAGASSAERGCASCCGGGSQCGDQSSNHSCTLMIELTQRCNLSCPTCYANSGPEQDHFLSLPQYLNLLDGLVSQGKGNADLIQLSGGEPTLHPDLMEIIRLTLERGYRQVYLNTNGVKLVQPEFASKLAALGPRLSIYLQFDGFDAKVNTTLRGRSDLLKTKLACLNLADELGLKVIPVMTLMAGVNDQQLGDFLEMAIHRPCVSKVMIQPVTYTGRHQDPPPGGRITVADVIRLLSKQTRGLLQEDDFTPIPCSDPNCFSFCMAFRTPQGLLPVSRYFPRYKNWSDPDVNKIITAVSDAFDDNNKVLEVAQWSLGQGLTQLDEKELDRLLEQLIHCQEAKNDAASTLFCIGIKPFMDAYTYDQDRIDKCCTHVVSRDGTPVSFCEYNALRRPLGRF